MEQKLEIKVAISTSPEEICKIIKQLNTSKGRKLLQDMFDNLLTFSKKPDIISKEKERKKE